MHRAARHSRHHLVATLSRCVRPPHLVPEQRQGCRMETRTLDGGEARRLERAAGAGSCTGPCCVFRSIDLPVGPSILHIAAAARSCGERQRAGTSGCR